MSTAGYFVDRVRWEYDDRAFSYVASQTDGIADVAEKLGISAYAIAGSMAEENHAYYTHHGKLVNDALDWEALRQIEATSILGVTCHTAWFLQYSKVVEMGLADSKNGRLQKGWYPVLVDMGQANFKMSTAIRLLIEYTAIRFNLNFSHTPYCG